MTTIPPMRASSGPVGRTVDGRPAHPIWAAGLTSQRESGEGYGVECAVPEIFGATISASGARHGKPSRPGPPLPSKTPSEEKTGPVSLTCRTPTAATVLPACDVHPASPEVKAKDAVVLIVVPDGPPIMPSTRLDSNTNSERWH